MADARPDRRRFLHLAAGALVPVVVGTTPRAIAGTLTGATDGCASDGSADPGGGSAGPSGHPEPRPGIDASRVLPADRVGPEVADLYDAVREIPQVVDGIRCHCGCAEVPGMYSLLSCYEESGMARLCDVCQGEGRLVTRLHREGRTLDEIRAAIDRRFG